MKKILKFILLITFSSLTFAACEVEDEGDELDIRFKTENGYTFEDETLPGDTDVTIGIEAETNKPSDPIIKFNISESVNGDTPSTVYSEDLDNTAYEYDFDITLGTNSGDTYTYTFTITNRDGINAQKSITLTVE